MIYFLISDQTNPYWNVAVENYLVAQPDTGAVVMYLWKNRRTVVVGKNQNPFSECNVDQLLGDGGYVMRRTTGGGAVYHDDGNINFSFVAPYSLYDQSRQFEVICRALRSYGLDAEISGRNDLICQGRKFSGNAFSKGRQQRLHHGTILIRGNMDDLARYLKVKPAKLQKHGVASVQSRVVNLSELADVTSENIVTPLRDAFEEVYGDRAVTMSFKELMRRDEVKELYSKFSSDDWVFGRWRNFKAEYSNQFEWGSVELGLEVDQERGIITDLTVSTDAIDVNLSDALRSILVGASTTTRPSVPADCKCDVAIVQDVLSIIY